MLDIGETTTDEIFAARVYDVLPSNPVFSHYIGSLTTSPCTEVIGELYFSERRVPVCVVCLGTFEFVSTRENESWQVVTKPSWLICNVGKRGGRREASLW